MGFVNYFDLEGPEFYSERKVKARKQHKCEECLKHIQPGQHYVRVSGKIPADSFWSYAICSRCWRIRQALEAETDMDFVLPFGEMKSALEERMEERKLMGRQHIDSLGWFKMHAATEEECSAKWGCAKPGERFRCYLCGYKFHVGSYWRMVMGTGSMVNFMVCDLCDYRWKSNDDELRRELKRIDFLSWWKTY